MHLAFVLFLFNGANFDTTTNGHNKSKQKQIESLHDWPFHIHMNILLLNVVFVVTLYMALHFICSFWIGFCFLLLNLPISFFSIINVISLGAITNKNSNSEQNQFQKACIIDLSKYAYTFPPLLQHCTSLCVYMFFINKVLFFCFWTC
jgi:hypothetical protein